MSNKISLPFQYTNKSISAWLSQFQASDILLMSHEVFKVLATLKKHHKEIDPVALGIVVMRLTPVVMHLSAALLKANIKHSQSRKIAHMSIRTLYYLAFLHIHLARKFEPKLDKALHANDAMQITGVAFQHCALAYQRPSIVLWECLSDCYELARNENILEMSVKSPISEFNALATVSLALKRVLLFWLANPYRFTQQDIILLFDFCTDNCSLINFIERGMSTEHDFCWDYRSTSDYQPVYMRPAVISDDCIVFRTQALINFEHKQSLNIDAVDSVIATLDQYLFLLENSKFTLSKPYVIVSRFDCVVDFFVKHVRQHQILTINTPAPEDLSFTSLAPIKEKKMSAFQLEKVSSADIWSHQVEEDEEVRKLKFGAMKLVQTSLSLFFVAETMAVELCVGDIFICYDSSFKPAIGISRRVEQMQRGAIQKSVVELCSGKVSLLQQIEVPQKSQSVAILLENGIEKQLFVAAAKYDTGKVLKFDQAEFVLERLIEVSPYFMRYSVSEL